MPRWNDWIAIAAAATLGLVVGATWVALAGPIQPDGWAEVLVLGVLTAFGLVATGAITFVAAERSSEPVRRQLAISAVEHCKESLETVRQVQQYTYEAWLLSAQIRLQNDADNPVASRDITEFIKGQHILRQTDEFGEFIHHYDELRAKIGNSITVVERISPLFIPERPIEDVKKDDTLVVNQIGGCADAWAEIEIGLREHRRAITKALNQNKRLIYG